ncbi:MAG: LPXTG cell wall anchor domain-containing protein [Actinomycetota bacterium]
MPGVASAQQASPVAVLPQVIEQPQVLAETLPRTGSSVVSMVVIALALLALGAVLVLGARRRNAGDASPA